MPTMARSDTCLQGHGAAAGDLRTRPARSWSERAAPVAQPLYGAATHNCRIRCLQPRGGNRHAVFHVTESEALTYHYELALSGPAPRAARPARLAQHQSRVDELGNVQQAIAIGYRRQSEFADESLDDRELRIDSRCAARNAHRLRRNTPHADVEIRADNEALRQR